MQHRCPHDATQVRDTQCGFKLFTRRTAAVLASNQRLQRWCFDVELLLCAQALGIPVSEVRCRWQGDHVASQ